MEMFISYVTEQKLNLALLKMFFFIEFHEVFPKGQSVNCIIN